MEMLRRAVLSLLLRILQLIESSKRNALKAHEPYSQTVYKADRLNGNWNKQ